MWKRRCGYSMNQRLSWHTGKCSGSSLSIRWWKFCGRQISYLWSDGISVRIRRIDNAELRSRHILSLIIEPTSNMDIALAYTNLGVSHFHRTIANIFWSSDSPWKFGFLKNLPYIFPVRRKAVWKNGFPLLGKCSLYLGHARIYHLNFSGVR